MLVLARLCIWFGVRKGIRPVKHRSNTPIELQHLWDKKKLNWGNSSTRAKHGNKGLKTMMMMGVWYGGNIWFNLKWRRQINQPAWHWASAESSQRWVRRAGRQRVDRQRCPPVGGTSRPRCRWPDRPAVGQKLRWRPCFSVWQQQGINHWAWWPQRAFTRNF